MVMETVAVEKVPYAARRLSGGNAENKAGRQKFLAMRAEAADQPVEKIGRELRQMMTFLKKKKEAGVPQEAAAG